MKRVKNFLGKVVRIIVIFSVIGLIITGTFSVATAFYSVIYEERIVQKKLDNTYVNEKFVGWDKETLDGWEIFLIPNHWKISREGRMLYLLDDENSTVAYGGLFGNQEDGFKTREEYFLALREEEILEVKEESGSGLGSMNTSYCGRVIVTDNDGQTNYLYASLWKNASEKLVFYFPYEEGDDDLLEVVQAIVFSYAFQNE